MEEETYPTPETTVIVVPYEETPAPVAEVPTVDKVRVAAEQLVALYEKSHTVKSVADYRYPGLKELVEALRA